MIAYIKGAITYKSPTVIFLETSGGVAYTINVSLYTYARIEKLESTKLYTYYHVNQQDFQPSLYGFFDEVERNVFTLLIAVKGVSVNSARIILSAMTPQEVRTAVLSENEAAFKKVKGIGTKTAKQIILDLKDKVVKESGEPAPSISPVSNTLREEALSALLALQIPRIQAQKALTKTMKAQPEATSVETLIKLALKQLGG